MNKILTLRNADPLNNVLINDADLDIPEESVYSGELESMTSNFILNVSEITPSTESMLPSVEKTP